MQSTPLTTDVQQLHILLQEEREQLQKVREQKDQALEKVRLLEAENAHLKSVLAEHQLLPKAVTVEAVIANEVPAAGGTAEATHEFQGELILVVDDQPMNLDLVAALLEDINLEIVCKTSALEALEFMQSARPRIILMDIQMPEMDGYCATQKIRADFTELNPVILAMTANDTETDRQKSLASGMQGHICKPIDADYLIAQLAFWLGQTATLAAANSVPLSDHACEQAANFSSITASTNTDSPPADVISSDLPGIDLPSALARLRGNRKLLEEVLVSFADKAALIIPELRQAKRENNLDEATRLLHRLKGTSANLSAYKIAPLAAMLETQCKNAQMPDEESLLDLDIAINEIIITAQQLLQSQQPAITPTSDQAIERAELEPLLMCISSNLQSDLGAAEEAVEALNNLCAHTPWAESASQLRALFYQFNQRAVNDLISNGFR